MPTPLLTTKLHILPIRAELVSRPRLIERLNAGLDRKLTLICAPAGFGKTTLVGEWVLGRSGASPPPAVAGHSIHTGRRSAGQNIPLRTVGVARRESRVGSRTKRPPAGRRQKGGNRGPDQGNHALQTGTKNTAQT
jgi:LuxR family maltose regulon positive regulatory protein